MDLAFNTWNRDISFQEYYAKYGKGGMDLDNAIRMMASSPINRPHACDGKVTTSEMARQLMFLAHYGKTTLRGVIQFPSGFDPSKKYPVLVPVYGGPASASNTARETFIAPNALAEYGFLVVNLDSRAAPGMGKRTLDSIYLKLGQVEIDDMAEGVKALASRPYFDPNAIEDDWEGLTRDPAGPLFNRATQSTYVPGSTFKTVVAAAATDLGLLDLDRQFRCTRPYRVGELAPDCNNHSHDPEVNFYEAFAWSCNRTHALVALGENALQYGAAARAASKKLAILRYVASDGNA